MWIAPKQLGNRLTQDTHSMSMNDPHKLGLPQRRGIQELVDAFAGLLETLQVILPYVRDLDFVVGGISGREVALLLHEGSFTVPGWMLSTVMSGPPDLSITRIPTVMSAAISSSSPRGGE